MDITSMYNHNRICVLYGMYQQSGDYYTERYGLGNSSRGDAHSYCPPDNNADTSEDDYDAMYNL